MDIQFNKQKNAKFRLDVHVSELFVCLDGSLRPSESTAMVMLGRSFCYKQRLLFFCPI